MRIYLNVKGLVQVQFERTKSGCTSLSIFLKNFVNNISKNSSNLNLIDFSSSLNKLLRFEVSPIGLLTLTNGVTTYKL